MISLELKREAGVCSRVTAAEIIKKKYSHNWKVAQLKEQKGDHNWFLESQSLLLKFCFEFETEKLQEEKL